MKFGKWLVAVHIVATAFTSLSYAAEPRGPCAEDIKKFCADVKPGAGGIAACLKQHEAEVSTACATHQQKMRDKADAFNAACGDDVKKYCGDVKPGKGRMIGCLRSKEAELSAACKTKIAKEPRKTPAPNAAENGTTAP